MEVVLAGRRVRVAPAHVAARIRAAANVLERAGQGAAARLGPQDLRPGPTPGTAVVSREAEERILRAADQVWAAANLAGIPSPWRDPEVAATAARLLEAGRWHMPPEVRDMLPDLVEGPPSRVTARGRAILERVVAAIRSGEAAAFLIDCGEAQAAEAAHKAARAAAIRAALARIGAPPEPRDIRVPWYTRREPRRETWRRVLRRPAASAAVAWVDGRWVAHDWHLVSRELAVHYEHGEDSRVAGIGARGGAADLRGPREEVLLLGDPRPEEEQDAWAALAEEAFSADVAAWADEAAEAEAARAAKDAHLAAVAEYEQRAKAAREEVEREWARRPIPGPDPGDIAARWVPPGD